MAAVEEGRGIYENIRKFVAFLLSANAGEVLIMFIATLTIFDPRFLPFFAPVQLLWINLVTDGLPALALGVDPYPTDIMDRPPRNPKEGVLSRDILFLIVIVSAILTVGTLGVFFLELLDGADATRARTVAFTTIVFFELFLVFAMRSPRQTIWQIGFPAAVEVEKLGAIGIPSNSGQEIQIQLFSPRRHGGHGDSQRN